ncbi:MAG: ribonuclease P protein component [Pseudomonadota bacterium]
MTSTNTDRHLDRLKKRSDFLWAQKNGKKWVSKGLIIIASKNEGLGRRFGVTVTKRLSKKAVDRNRMKRRLRAVAQDIIAQYGQDHTDYVLIGRAETATRVYTDLQNDLKWCLKKLEVYQNEESSELSD